MRVITERLAHRDDERGAVAVIVALCLVAIFAMVVLTVDVGGLLLERRSMVNAADAAALAAAQSCANNLDTTIPEEQADTYAAKNVTDLPVNGIDPNITEMVGCDTATGHVSVRYSEQHDLFFAAILPSGQRQGTITTVATAAWGPLGGGFAIPIVLESDYLQGTCKIPDGIEVDERCAFWYNNKEITGAGNWGFMNLDKWNVPPDSSCPNSGSNLRGEWITNGYPDQLVLNGNPPGTAPTYVCAASGHAASSWYNQLQPQEGKIKLFPVNDCDGQLDKKGVLSPCPETPEYYDIIGFTSLLIEHVYKGNDPAAIGSGGSDGDCGTKKPDKNWTTNPQTLDLDSITSGTTGWAGCSGTATDTATVSNVVIRAKGGAVYTQCPPTGGSNCAYRYDPASHVVTWVSVPTTETDVSFHWEFAGSPGACGVRPSDSNAVCLVTIWKGFTTGPGPVGGGQDFGPHAVKLCDLDFAVGCPDQG